MSNNPVQNVKNGGKNHCSFFQIFGINIQPRVRENITSSDPGTPETSSIIS
jgi:hypothetical protein